MADFMLAVTRVIGPGPEPGGYEGGLVDDPTDPGGLTNYGIAVYEHPELTRADIEDMTYARAVGIYRKFYWHDLYGQIQSQALANSVFDFGVTSGVRLAVQTLQGIVFVHGSQAIDDEFGPATLAAVNRLPAFLLIREFTVERLRFYVALNKPADLNSWFTRTIDALV